MLFSRRSSGGFAKKHIPAYPETGSIMTVYVDEIMMASRAHDGAALWASLEQVVEFGDPLAPIQKFSGGMHDFKTHDGISEQTVNMKDFFVSAVQHYMDEVKVSSLPTSGLRI